MRSFVLLMGHGTGVYPPSAPYRESTLSTEGVKPTAEVAGRLAEVLREWTDEPIRLAQIWHGGHGVSVYTASVVERILTLQGRITPGHRSTCTLLDPEVFQPYGRAADAGDDPTRWASPN
jgi:hypothetical protein